MLKRFFPIACALALTIGIGTGCQDSQVSAPQNDAAQQGGALNTALPQADYGIDGNVDLVASFDDAMNGASVIAPPPTGPNDGRGGDGGRGGRGHGRDSANGGDGGHGGRDTARGGDDGGRGGDAKRPPCLQDDYLRRLIGNLRLTREQMAAIRECQADLKACVDGATRHYHAAHKALMEELRAELHKILEAVRNGRITPEEGRRRWNAVRELYREKFTALQKRYMAALEGCCDDFNLCVRHAIGGGHDGGEG